MSDDEVLIESIEYSDTATAVFADGTMASAFQRASYLARVQFEDAGVVLVALPVGAARRGPPSDFEEDVRDIARASHWPGQAVTVDMELRRG